jgi:hypothetical protein
MLLYSPGFTLVLIYLRLIIKFNHYLFSLPGKLIDRFAELLYITGRLKQNKITYIS